MLTCDALLPLLDARVTTVMSTQVLDRSRADFGGFVSQGVAGGTGVGQVVPLCYAYLMEGSVHYRSTELLERILLGAGFGRRVRRESGLFDLVETNFDSAPDTGFLVQLMSPVVVAAREAADDEGAGEIAGALGELIRTATPGMAAGGFHTPNHRWVLVSALAQARALFPDLDVMDTIEAYLAETIDINADGEYTERSTGVYNAVCNRSLRIAAEALDRPELLGPVRKNLELSYYLLHADGTVITSVSRRQDRGQRTVPVGLADTYYALGRMENNGFYAAVADWLFDLEPGGLPWTLHPFLEHPEWREDTLKREALPKSYSKVFPVSGLWRVRRGRLSATAASGIAGAFSLKYGEAELSAVTVCASYYSTGQFAGEDFRESEDGIRMTHRGRGWHYDSPGYFHPLGEPVKQSQWEEARWNRRFTPVPPLSMDLTVNEVEGGFDLRIQADALDRVPLQFACDFAPGGEFDLDGGAMQGIAGQTVFLKSGYAIYHVADDAITIGPGAFAHRMWRMRGSEQAPQGFRVLITLVTPADRTLEVRCGAWSAATEGILKSVD
ncbi:MAG: hypothetical protein OXU79_13685 [Gemmatimonadota bacterium]|nr:hypothetical protein [Gemmatimonadota bacterium]